MNTFIVSLFPPRVFTSFCLSPSERPRISPPWSVQPLSVFLNTLIKRCLCPCGCQVKSSQVYLYSAFQQQGTQGAVHKEKHYVQCLSQSLRKPDYDTQRG
ncbi:hypothetical protein AMECASPLE_018061 [Ameca splendens]|uniref:Uncharacterized protein n=1 Tax=Ameca splendens TaxID=208324 RepID=A0ABV1AC77_9TELE